MAKSIQPLRFITFEMGGTVVKFTAYSAAKTQQTTLRDIKHIT